MTKIIQLFIDVCEECPYCHTLPDHPCEEYDYWCEKWHRKFNGNEKIQRWCKLPTKKEVI